VKKVYIAVLTMGSIRRELAPMLFLMRSDPRYDVKIRDHGLRPSSYNRNNIVEEFLKTDCDYLLCIDHDTVPLKNPLDLVAFDKDVIGCPYPQIVGKSIGFLAMETAKDGNYQQVKVTGGLQELDALGSGAMLIARRVLEKVEIPFERKWVDGVPIRGLDFYFCEKARALGFTIWTHWGYLASHYKTVDLLTILEMMNNLGSRLGKEKGG